MEVVLALGAQCLLGAYLGLVLLISGRCLVELSSIVFCKVSRAAVAIWGRI